MPNAEISGCVAEEEARKENVALKKEKYSLGVEIE